MAWQDFLKNNSQGLTQAGIGLLSGRNPQEQFAMGAQGFMQGQQANKTAQWVAQNAPPEIAQAVQAGVISPAEAFQAMTQAKTKKAPLQINGKLVDPETYQVLADFSSSREQEETFFGNPIPITNPDGSTVYGQIGNRGSFRPIQLGEGQTFAPPVKTVDMGTGTALIGPGGTQVGVVQKDLAGAESEKALGQARGEAAASAAGDLQAGLNAKALIEQIKTNPYLDRGTGMSSVLSNVPGTGGYDFQNLVDQAKSGAFLTAIQQMRGLGALSNAEGGAATQAVTRMNTATSKEAFLKAVDDYEKIIDQGIARAQSRMPAGAAPAGGMDYKTKYGLD
jgi:hypothetical protein